MERLIRAGEHMELHEIGTLLRSERQKQGLSIEQVVEKTRISRRNLTALEAGDESQMPHPVYAKGFVKAYAGLLGLNAEEIGCEFSRAYGVQDESCQAYEEPSKKEQLPSSRRATLFLAMAVLLLAVGGMTFFFVSAGRQAPEAEFRTDAPAREQIPQPPPPKAGAPLPEEEAAPDAEQPPDELPAPDPADLPQQSDTSQIADQVPQRTEQVVGIAAAAPCWVQARADGRRIERLLRPGQSMSLTFTSSLSVRLGNAGGVRVSYNGAPYPLNGQPGEVRVLTFP
jgi:cytoskeleton protein RodZ